MPADLIPPDMRARLRGLRIVPRRGAGGDGVGQHRSRNRGAGLEFAQYRGYEPGDEPRRIDWKLYARSDRWFVREAERDSALALWLLLDASASMGQADLARPHWRKFDAVRLLAACVFEVALHQGDRFGFATLSGADVHAVPPQAGARQRDRCRVELARIEPRAGWPGEEALRPLRERIPADALVVVVSDFFDDAATEFATRFAAAGREVVAIQCLCGDEREFPFRGPHRFVDPESGAERRVEAGAVRRDFLARFAVAQSRLASGFAARGIRLAECWLDREVDAPLHALFGNRPGALPRAGTDA